MDDNIEHMLKKWLSDVDLLKWVRLGTGGEFL
jgi:hypothetical protein